MKKTIVLILALALVLTLAACGKTDTTAPTDPTDAPETTAADAGTEPAATEETAEPTETSPTDAEPAGMGDGGEAAETTDAADTTAEAETTTERVWEAATLTVKWAEDVIDLKNEIGVILSDDDPVSRAVIYTDKAVREFRALALSAPEVDDDGNLSFAATERYVIGVLEPENPIVLTVTFYGDLPSWGVSYVDETGKIRTFALDVSGEDGAAVLTEVTVR